ncbi:MAG TPA: M48 family peptidase, partial [Gammaproteobacteria bacterium]|nr:M48 family peptidase [Gammaproteobacteria bacterium]
MQIFTRLFVAALLLTAAIRFALALRQIHHVQRCRGQVPEPFATDISLAAHQKAADYTVAKTRLTLLSLVLDLILTLVWTLGGGLATLDDLWWVAGLGPLTTGVLVIGSFALLNMLVGLPLGIYSTFGVEADFGFNRTTPQTYIVDMLKGLALAVALGAPLLYAALFLMRKSGDLWWVYVWTLWFGFSLLMIWAYPVFIAPLFNKFSPLQDPDLKQRIETL